MGCDLKKLAELVVEGAPESKAAKQFKNILAENTNEILGAKQSTIPEKFNSEDNELKVDALKSIKGMRSVLEELTDSTLKPSYVRDLHKILDSIDPQFIPKMNLYINNKAEENDGMINVKDIIINTKEESVVDTAEMSAAEVYMHELVHSITKFAINGSKTNTPARTIIRQIEVLRATAQEHTTWRHLMPKQSLDRAADEKIARERWDYIFNGKNSIHEFIAHGMTNPAFINRLRKIQTKDDSDITLLGAIKRAWKGLLDLILGETSFHTDKGTVQHELIQLTFELMETNNKAVNNIAKNRSLTYDVGKFIDKYGNEPLAKVVEFLSNKLSGDNMNLPKKPRNASKIEEIIWAMRLVPRIMVDSKLKGLREGVLSAFGMSPEGTVQNIIRDIQRPDELERKIEKLGMMSDSLDAIRQMTIKTTRDDIYREFNKKLSKKEEEAITLSGIDLDLGVIYKKYGKDKVADLLSNRDTLTKQIKKVTTQLKRFDSQNFNWNVNQATGLGYYIATHRAGLAQNLNAHNIARGILTDNRRKASAHLVQLIDELATLNGIKYTAADSNTMLAELIREEPNGVEHIININEGIKKESLEKLFATKAQVIKGYSKELFDPTVTVEIRPLDIEIEMNENGFELIQELEQNKNDNSNVKKMGIYKTKHYVNNTYNRTATRMTDMIKRGTTIIDTIRMSENTLVEQRAKAAIRHTRKMQAKAVQQMIDGTFTPDPKDTLAPVLDQFGNVTNFRYMMNKQIKKELLNQDTTVTEVLGKTLGSIDDKVGTRLHNEDVLELIQADMKKNFDPDTLLGKNNGMQYVKIEANSYNPVVSDIYKILPANMKQAIKDSDKGYIAVRQDMLHNYFGFRDGSFLDFLPLLGPSLQKNMKILDRWIKYAEAIWRDIVSISKVDIIIRTPAVFIGNIISNFMYSVVMGTNPMTVAKLQYDNTKNLTKYMKNVEEISRLRVQHAAGKNTKSALERLEAEQKVNPVHELMEAGMYQAIVEDINKRDLKSSNRLVDRAKNINIIKNTPEFIRTGVNWLYINENTKLFKAMTTMTQYSDFIARATEYQLQLKRGIPKKKAQENVLDAFINYGKPASSFEEYLNDMGFIMFTKYAKRIQRVIQQSGKEKPMNIILSILGQEMFMGVDDIWDQHPMVRSYNNIGISPIEHIQRMITPTALEIL